MALSLMQGMLGMAGFRDWLPCPLPLTQECRKPPWHLAHLARNPPTPGLFVLPGSAGLF